uniref:Ovule protein n=1 Tax=Parascaris univalens TaxID=6257 RepID=A0A915AQC1_PARUN
MFQQYSISTQPIWCTISCQQECTQNEAQRCYDSCLRSCTQSVGQSPFESIAWRNYPIYLRPGLSPLAPKIPFYGNIMAQSAQSQNVQQLGNGSGSGSSKSMYMICIPICMPKCAQQCINQQHTTSGIVGAMNSITRGTLDPMIPQERSSIVPQDPVPVITPQGETGGPSPDIARGSMISQETRQMLPQGSSSMNPSQSIQMMSQFAEVMVQLSGCVSACPPACSVTCAQQNLTPSQAIGSLVYVTLPSTYAQNSGKVESATQQSTKECQAACLQQCSAQCVQNQPQPLPLKPDPAPIQSQVTSMPTHFRASSHLEPLLTECLPTAIKAECVCPRGFIVCVDVSGSSHCCSRW